MQLRGTQIVVDTVASKRPVISGSGATRSLNETESGSLVLFDKADGIVYTLPAPKPGINYDFMVLTTITSNAAKIIGNLTGATSNMVGTVSLVNQVDNTSKGYTSLSATNNIAISMNGGTTGGMQGATIRVFGLSSGTWLVTGLITASGTLATPFATS